MIGRDPRPEPVSFVTWGRWLVLCVVYTTRTLAAIFFQQTRSFCRLNRIFPLTRQFYQAIYLSEKKGLKINTSAPQTTSNGRLVH